ncbi:MAG: ThiF family adenylyltransferase [Phycisphaerae bacterium]|nr:ThiF family adenylyltransferase [Phycisphaerae bacterium]
MSESVRTEPSERDPALERYSRQALFQRIGEAGQRRLLASRAVVIGVGALGSVIAGILARAGVGFLRIIDRDYLELNNLQRQELFDESDLEAGLPKAATAANKLARINSAIRIEPHVVDLNRTNVERLIDGCDVILDGTDNFETRFLINDAAIKQGVPWIYGACIGATGMVMPILPGETPCLRCVWDSPPPAGMNPTCDTAGVLAPIVHIVAATQALEAIKLLTGQRNDVSRGLLQIDAWMARLDRFDFQSARAQGECTCCVRRSFEYLDGARTGGTAALCGRNAVQIAAPPGQRIDLADLGRRLAPVAADSPRVNAFMLRARVDRYDVTVFTDGRAIIKGTSEPDEARSVYARYVGA